jgi:hypothetical protein
MVPDVLGIGNRFRRTGSCNQAIRIVELLAGSACVIATVKVFPIGIVHDQAFVIVATDNNDMAKFGEVAMNNHWIARIN